MNNNRAVRWCTYECFNTGGSLGERCVEGIEASSSRWTAIEKRFQKAGSRTTAMLRESEGRGRKERRERTREVRDCESNGSSWLRNGLGVFMGVL